MKRIVLIGGAVLVLLLLAVAALPFLIDPNTFRPMLESRLSQALGREVKLGELKLSILSGSVTANDLSIADDPAYSRTPFVQAKSLAIGVEVWPLIASRQLHVTGLTIEAPTIALIQSPNGEWNFSKLGASRAAESPKAPTEPAAKTSMDLSVKLVKITGGRFSVGTTGAHSRPLVLEDVKLEVRDFSSSSAFPFTFDTKVAGGGTIKLDGKAGPLDPVDVAASPLGATLDVDKLDLAGTGLMQNAPAISGLIGFIGRAIRRQNGTRAGEAEGREPEARQGRQARQTSRGIRFRSGSQHGQALRAAAQRRHQNRQRQCQPQRQLRGGPRIGGTADEAGRPKMAIPELASMLPAMGIVLPNGSSLEGGTASIDVALQGPWTAW